MIATHQTMTPAEIHGAAPTDTLRHILLARQAGTDLVYLLDDAGKLTADEREWLTERGMYDREVALYG